MSFFEKTRWLWRALCFAGLLLAGLLLAIDGIINASSAEAVIGAFLCGTGASAGWKD